MFDLELKEGCEKILLSLLLNSYTGVKNLYLEALLVVLINYREDEDNVSPVRIVLHSILGQIEQCKLKVLPIQKYLLLNWRLPYNLEIDLSLIQGDREWLEYLLDQVFRAVQWIFLEHKLLLLNLHPCDLILVKVLLYLTRVFDCLN